MLRTMKLIFVIPKIQYTTTTYNLSLMLPISIWQVFYYPELRSSSGPLSVNVFSHCQLTKNVLKPVLLIFISYLFVPITLKTPINIVTAFPLSGALYKMLTLVFTLLNPLCLLQSPNPQVKVRRTMSFMPSTRDKPPRT